MQKIITLALALLLTFGAILGCASTKNVVTQTDEPAVSSATQATDAPQITDEPTAAPTETPATRIFTDSVGRQVEIPYTVESIAVSGPLAQIAVFALAPDMLVGVSSEWDAAAQAFIPEEYYNLPNLGQLYGGKGELNLEVLLASGAQVIIDVGEPKSTIVEDLDALQAQTGIPFVHITMTTETAADAYIQLGELLGREEYAQTLATYCDEVLTRTKEIASTVEKTRVVYCLGESGLNVIAKGSFHGEIIDLLCDNVAVVDDVSSKGTGNEITMEQLMLWDPEVILFAPDSVYGMIGSDPTWQSLTAISSNNFYEVPFGPYNWMGFPPSVQRYLGMIWLSQLLYPETAQYNAFAEVANYFALFYHVELSEQQIGDLMLNSLGRK